MVNPYDGHDVYDQATGGLRRRFTTGAGQPGPVPSSRPKKLRTPKGERPRRLAAPRQAPARRHTAGPRAPAPNKRGNHHAHKTEKAPKGRQGNLHAPHAQARLPEALLHVLLEQAGMAWSPYTGQAFGHS